MFETITKMKAFAYTPASEPTTSFAGGTPYMNDDFAYPTDSNGEPLVFLFQVDLSKVGDIGLVLPKTGFLQFYTANDILYGMESWESRNAESQANNNAPKKPFVVYLKQAEDRENDMPEINETPLFEPQERVYYQGEIVEMLPFPYTVDADMVLSTLEDKENVPDGVDLEDAYNDYYESAEEPYYEFYLGGYPHFTQDDYRHDKGKENMVLLLGSETGAASHLMWGDSGTAGYWMTPQDIEEHNYQNAELYWDCC